MPNRRILATLLLVNLKTHGEEGIAYNRRTMIRAPIENKVQDSRAYSCAKSAMMMTRGWLSDERRRRERFEASFLRLVNFEQKHQQEENYGVEQTAARGLLVILSSALFIQGEKEVVPHGLTLPPASKPAPAQGDSLRSGQVPCELDPKRINGSMIGFIAML